MLESELFSLSWLHNPNNGELFDEYYGNCAPTIDMDDRAHHLPHFGLSPYDPFSSTVHQFVDNNMDFEFPFDGSSLPLDVEGVEELMWSQEGMENICGLLKAGDDQETSYSFLQHYSEGKKSVEYFSLSPSVSVDASREPLITIPTEGMELNNQLSLKHLARAYCEAMENIDTELADVIMQCISQKVSPVGETRDRLLYHYGFHQPTDMYEKQADYSYIKQESTKNSCKAFKAFYQIFPYGMIAHFTANSAILEAMPHNADVLHIADFDIAEGVQWSSMMMAISRSTNIVFKLTSIKWREEEDSCWRKFEDTKRQLQDFANSLGIRLHMKEIELQDLATEMKRMRKQGGRRDWLAFNCMWALPHMGRRRSRRQVMEFLAVAKDVLSESTIDSRGLVTFGDGSYYRHHTLTDCLSFGSFFESYMKQYHALLESIEGNFPVRLSEARLTMEFLFLAPYVSCVTVMQTWKEIKDGGSDIMRGFGFEGLRMRNDSLMEAKEMMRGECLYGVRIEGEKNNEMVLEWRGTPLMRVSAWR